MDLIQELGRQAIIEDLVSALRIPSDKKLHIGIALYDRNIDDLFTTERDVASVKNKLSGKKVILTSNQKELAVVVEHLADFEDAIGPWVTSFSKGDTAYAVEHVLDTYNADTNKFGSRGTGSGSGLVKKLDFGDLQTLRRYSRFAEMLDKIYQDSGRHDLSFRKEADAVARLLVGKSINVPVIESSTKKQEKTVLVIETEGYENDEEVSQSRYCMLASPGELRVMPFRGLNLVNIGTLKTDSPSCVMIRAIGFDSRFIEGPGRVGNVLDTKQLEGKVLGKDIELTGRTAKSGYIPGSGEYSTGRYRLQTF